MHNRLRELAEQAGITPGVMGLNRFTHFDPEKFAELILLDVRELIQEEAYINKVVMVDVVLGQLLHAIEERFNG